MQEAIDYNALSWVRQELAETLKHARHHLEEYASSKGRESLQGCAAHLHEARGPLQMVNLKGADLLTGEMEEVIGDLLLDAVDQSETALELLMQGFLELPEYLYSLRAGRPDKLDVLFPLINSLRAIRGEQPLEEDVIFSPDLSIAVPRSVFDPQADHPQQDVAALARAARVRFQGGLLDWYRNGAESSGLQSLIDVLDHLQQHAGSEPAARLWWVSSGVAELLRDGILEVTPDIKRLFGQIDRAIKRLMDQGEAVFSDVLTDDLLKNLLFHIYKTQGSSPCVVAIKSTYGLDKAAAGSSSAANDDAVLPTCSEQLLQTVSGTVREDIVRIKEQLDEFLKDDRDNLEVLTSVADELHALGNMLGMIGVLRLGHPGRYGNRDPGEFLCCLLKEDIHDLLIGTFFQYREILRPDCRHLLDSRFNHFSLAGGFSFFRWLDGCFRRGNVCISCRTRPGEGMSLPGYLIYIIRQCCRRILDLLNQ